MEDDDNGQNLALVADPMQTLLLSAPVVEQARFGLSGVLRSGIGLIVGVTILIISILALLAVFGWLVVYILNTLLNAPELQHFWHVWLFSNATQ